MSRPQQMAQLLDQTVELCSLAAELAHGAGDFFVQWFMGFQHYAHTGPNEVRKASRALHSCQMLQPVVFLVGETEAD
jgi:hypothetical protein